MNRKLIDILEKCISSMEAGVPLENCLREYPEYAPELSKLLKTVEIVKTLRVENIPIEARIQNQKKILTQAESLRAENKRSKNSSSIDWLLKPLNDVAQYLRVLSPVASKLVLALGIAGIFILFSGGLLITSAKSLPGDSLYPVKRAVEDIKVYLAPSDEIRHEYEDAYSQKRVEEVNLLIGLTREQKISFEGIINSMGESHWSVSGIPVVIQPDTEIVAGVDGGNTVVPGMWVEVEGNTGSQGQVYANEIHLREYQFSGTVEEIISNNWKISGTPVIITPITQIDPGIRVGDEVTVLIRSEDDGLFALAILQEMPSKVSSTPFLPVEITPTPDEELTIESEEAHHLHGILDQITANYWIVSGEVIYIVSNTQLDDGIDIGEYISVHFKTEQNGSYTAIEIKRNDDGGKPEDIEGHETPEGKGDDEEQGSNNATPTEVKEPEESRQPYEHEGTPKPTESH
jgi:hypothetical protein